MKTFSSIKVEHWVLRFTQARRFSNFLQEPYICIQYLWEEYGHFEQGSNVSLMKVVRSFVVFPLSFLFLNSSSIKSFFMILFLKHLVLQFILPKSQGWWSIFKFPMRPLHLSYNLPSLKDQYVSQLQISVYSLLYSSCIFFSIGFGKNVDSYLCLQ